METSSRGLLIFYGSLTNVGVNAEKGMGRSGIKALPCLVFFKAFSGRFSKYLFRKTLLHAQKVNSQPKGTTPDSYRQEHRKIRKKTYNCDTDNVVSAVYCLSEVSLQRANLITSL